MIPPYSTERQCVETNRFEAYADEIPRSFAALPYLVADALPFPSVEGRGSARG